MNREDFMTEPTSSAAPPDPHACDHDLAHEHRTTVNGEPLIPCRRCKAQLWGRHRHVLVPHLGDPHYLTCEDCQTVLGTRQLPHGRSPHTTASGVICARCAEARAKKASLEATRKETV